MKFIKDAIRFTAIAESSEGFPNTSIANEGDTLHFIDTGEEYIFHEGMWEFDLRRARALEMVYNDA